MDPDVPRGDSLRVGDDERERTVATLHRHAERGRLEPEELDQRVSAALSARTAGELAVLTRDLPDETPEEPAPARRLPGARRIAVQRWRRHAAVWFVMSLFFIAIWAATGGEEFWPIWPILGWGLAVALQGAKLLTPHDDEDEGRALPRGT